MSSQKAIQQEEMIVIQKMAELILKKFLPAKKTIRNIHSTMIEIISSFYETGDYSEVENDKQKTKKNPKKGTKDKILV